MTARGALRVLSVTALLALAGCAAPDSTGKALPVVGGESAAGTREAADFVLPPRGAPFDYQIGGGYEPPEGVRTVIRDRSDGPADGLYNICYVNGFQVQPGELGWWREEHPELLLRGADGELVVDSDWDEALVDISTRDKRTAAAGVVGAWLEGCAESGFDAVELDNLDSWTRSQSLLSSEDAVAFAARLTSHAHAAGLAAGQKNAAKLIGEADGEPVAGFDFAVAEECGRWDECGIYASAYPGRVLGVEYRDQDMLTACTYTASGVSVVLRDLDVTKPGSPEYTYGTCAGMG